MADCLLAKASFLRYDTALATGVAEGACRWLVKDRMGITGARWGWKVPQLSSSSAPFKPTATSTPSGISACCKNTRASTRSDTAATSRLPHDHSREAAAV